MKYDDGTVGNKAIEFQSQLENGMIQVPAACGLLDGQDVRIPIRVNEVAANQTSTRFADCFNCGSQWLDPCDEHHS